MIKYTNNNFNISDLDNPFSITKATEFSNQQIIDYWVDYNTGDDKSLLNILNPSEYMPKYILGGKGCGKTHILRYFSYPLQMIRANNDITELLTKDKYLGIYSVLDGLNSSRFQKKGISDDVWKSVFEYYFELYICDNLFTIIKDIFDRLEINEESENLFVQNVLNIFYNHKKSTAITNINELILFFSELRKKIDFEIVNAPFNRKLDYESVTVLFSPSNLLFGIPKILSEIIPQLKNIKFIYIFDEYEKLLEWQKVFINTIVWDKKIPCTFWIGARKYGYTTRETLTEEPIRPGSEFQPIELDKLIRTNDKIYKKFAKELYLKRLNKYFSQRGVDHKPDVLEAMFSDKFEKYDAKKTIQELGGKCKNKQFKHIPNLRKKLEEALKLNCAYGLFKSSDIDTVINKLILNTNGNPLEQKYKIFLFYQNWAKAKEHDSLIEIADLINTNYELFLIKQKTEFDNVKEKFKKDLLAQLTSENNIKNKCYSGINDFIEISWGNPRVFLIILKSIIERSKFLGEKPLNDNSLISLEAQFQGIYETAKWFYEDADIIGDIGLNTYKSIAKLADLFKLYRFSDKPPETSVSTFNFTLEEQSEETVNIIKSAESHSLIVKIENGRKEKNTGRVEESYQINKTIAPLWNLPIHRRGVVSLNKELLESIFNPKFHELFKKQYKALKRNYNAPFNCKFNSESENNNLKLFDD